MAGADLAWLRTVRSGLLEAAPAIAAALTIDELAETTVAHLREVLGVDVAAALLHDADVPAFACSNAPSIVDPRRSRDAMASSCGRSLNAKVAARFVVAGVDRACAIGLRTRDGRDVGALAVSEARVDTEDEILEVLAQFGHIVAAALDNVALHRAASRAVQARDDVMAIVSHDLRAPLGTIRMGVSLLQDTAQPADQEILARLGRSVTHLTRLVDDLVDMVRIDGHSLDVTPKPERVSEIFDMVSAIVLPMAETANVECRLHAPPNEQTVFADRHRVIQVLTNLIGNAIKFTPAGGSVDVFSEERGDETMFRVRDTGRGIQRSEYEHVFTRYWRSDAKRKRGLGLGLHIAKGVVDAHRGRIWFESQVGLGTTFLFTLPRYPTPVVATDAPEAERVTVPGRQTPTGNGWRALVADDDEDMRFLMASALRRVGFGVHELSNGRELLSAFEESPLAPTIVVSDIGMPEVDGIVAAGRLSAKSPKPPIVLVTAFGDRLTIDKAKAAGADRVLLKPLDIALLVQTTIALTRPQA